MSVPTPLSEAQLVIDLAVTLRHDGHGGVADDLAEPAGLTAWVRERQAALPVPVGYTADAASLTAVRELRAAVRSVLARAVRPGEPSPADAGQLLPDAEAVALLNAAAALVPAAPVLSWPSGADPAVHQEPAARAPAHALVTAALARAAIAFLTGPDRVTLRACHGPRCVRYFLKEHPRQEWCKPSCGNRARVARHHERHRSTGR
ncbi:CGNR zinc finger domain-containing protein [Streptomyces apocyni]|uniref:CGNR zinc finger domain-containing protein n=1 Tax=Streptomyces apocyni TaxID=2654677 RepID=UPI0012EA54DE|nr:CGNR zinc finger domain-containing protein [Streptomyces apocyni]